MAAPASSSNAGDPSHLTPQLRAQRHLLQIEGEPSLAQFEALVALSSKSGAAGTAEDAELLDTMLDWSAALFLHHDRAVASSNLFADVEAALAVLRPNARRRSVSTSGGKGQHSSRRGSHSRSSKTKAQTEEEETDAAAIAAPGGPAASPAAADPFAAVIARMSAYPFANFIERISSELGDLVVSCGGEKVDASWECLNSAKNGPDDINVFYRKLEGSGTHSFLVSGIVKAPLMNILAMIKETDLMPGWLPAVRSADVVSVLDNSRYRMLLRVVIKALWPVSDREAMCYGYGDVVGNSVGIYFRSIDDAAKGEVIPGAGEQGKDVVVPPVTEGCVRASVTMGGFYITPNAEGSQCTVRAIFNVDPHLPIIPFWFLNVMSEKFCAVILQMMRDKAPTIFGRQSFQPPVTAESIMNGSSAGNATEYAKRLKTQSRVYEEIRRRIGEMQKKA